MLFHHNKATITFIYNYLQLFTIIFIRLFIVQLMQDHRNYKRVQESQLK